MVTRPPLPLNQPAQATGRRVPSWRRRRRLPVTNPIALGFRLQIGTTLVLKQKGTGHRKRGGRRAWRSRRGVVGGDRPPTRQRLGMRLAAAARPPGLLGDPWLRGTRLGPRGFRSPLQMHAVARPDLCALLWRWAAFAPGSVWTWLAGAPGGRRRVEGCAGPRAWLRAGCALPSQPLPWAPLRRPVIPFPGSSMHSPLRPCGPAGRDRPLPVLGAAPSLLGSLNPAPAAPVRLALRLPHPSEPSLCCQTPGAAPARLRSRLRGVQSHAVPATPAPARWLSGHGCLSPLSVTGPRLHGGVGRARAERRASASPAAAPASEAGLRLNCRP